MRRKKVMRKRKVRRCSPEKMKEKMVSATPSTSTTRYSFRMFEKALMQLFRVTAHAFTARSRRSTFFIPSVIFSVSIKTVFSFWLPPPDSGRAGAVGRRSMRRNKELKQSIRGIINSQLIGMMMSWQEYVNQFKTMHYGSPREIMRMPLSEQELYGFWQSRKLSQMESLFMLSNQVTINYLYTHLIPHQLAKPTRKITHEAYSVSAVDSRGIEQSLMYVYDCRLFKLGAGFSREENDFLSSFMLIYREDVAIQGRVNEVCCASSLPKGQWVLKVKESALLRVEIFMRETMRRVVHSQDKVILGEQKYDLFMQHWINFYCTYNLETAPLHFFRAVLVLLENQLMLAYLRLLPQPQVYFKVYNKPIRIVDKPRNVEQFTLTEGTAETETKWQTLKITAFKLKYRVEETATQYRCYLVPHPEEPVVDPSDLGEEDLKMLEGLALEGQQVWGYS